MEGYSDRQFFLEPQQTFHRQYEALRAVFVEGQPLDPVAKRFDYKVSTLQSMISRFRADRRCDVTPPFFARTAAGDRTGRLPAGTGRPRNCPTLPTPAS
jgi:hypothetical protein